MAHACRFLGGHIIRRPPDRVEGEVGYRECAFLSYTFLYYSFFIFKPEKGLLIQVFALNFLGISISVTSLAPFIFKFSGKMVIKH